MTRYHTREDSEYSCWVCQRIQKRVIDIPSSPSTYYCEACLFDCIRDGSLTIGSEEVTCESCSEPAGVFYCESCKDESAGTCEGCGYSSDSVYCNDCFWGDHSCYDNIECSECGSGYIDTRCNECRTIECPECGDEFFAGDMRCVTCSQLGGSVTVSDDGKEIHLDDDVVFNWGG
jgi:hypothetical protein